MINIVTTRSM